MNNKELGTYIKHLEEELLSHSIRRDPERLKELLADDFMEIGKSGRVFTKQEVIDTLLNEEYTAYEIRDYKLNFLTDTIALAAYTIQQKQIINGALDISIRSSVWRNIDGRWQICFHQGTQVKD